MPPEKAGTVSGSLNAHNNLLEEVAKYRAARLLLQMAAHRFAREVLAFQRLHFVTVGIGRFDLPLIQRLLPKALTLE